jgi:hypothetical protein
LTVVRHWTQPRRAASAAGFTVVLEIDWQARGKFASARGARWRVHSSAQRRRLERRGAKRTSSVIARRLRDALGDT